MKNKIYFYGVLSFLMIPANFFLVLVLSLNYFNKLSSFWNILYIFYAVLVIDTAFLALRIKQIPEYQRNSSQIVYFSKYLFLLSLIVLVLNQFLKRAIITPYMNYIIGVVIALGFLTFFASKNRVEKELEDEKTKEEADEKRRKNEFEYKFPKLAKLDIPYGWGDIKNNQEIWRKMLVFIGLVIISPIIFLIKLPYKLTKWMHKEGWVFSIVLIVIATTFLIIRIGMPIVNNGSYLDEYTHISSGIEFFKTGHFAEIYSGEYYNRGAFVSVIVGLFTYLFGQNIFAAKMVPIIIGIINFMLLFFISKKIIVKKKYILLLMSIFTLSPWVIFNHFYIRMYVFYEFFSILIIFLIINLISALEKGYKKLVLSIISIFLINILIFFLINDPGVYLVFLLEGLSLVNVFLFKSKMNKKIKLIIVVISLFIVLLSISVLNLYPLINTFINGKMTYTTPLNLKYDSLFFNKNIILTILFILSVTIFFYKKEYTQKIIILPIFSLFILHMISSKDLQITRGILYFFPLFFLISILTLSKIKENKIMEIILILSIFITLYFNYPPDFLETPNIPKEINYLDNNIYADAHKICNGSLIITSNRPAILYFFHIKPDYYVNTQFSDEKWVLSDEGAKFGYFQQESNLFFDSYKNTPIIISKNQLKSIVDRNKKVCFIYGGLPYNWIDDKTKEFIKDNFEEYNRTYKTNEDWARMHLYFKAK